MKKLYIHIGYPKTATSAIQAALSQNNELLQRYDYCYPSTGLIGVGQHNLANEIQDNAQQLTNPRIKQMFSEIRDTSARNIILSSERFASFSPEEIATLKSLCAGFEVYIVVYLRRQDDFLQSLWSQRAKTGRQKEAFVTWVEALLKTPGYNVRLPHSGISSLPVTPDYAQMLDIWAQAFGADHILVRPFERSQLHPNIVADILQTCGLHDVAWVPDAPQVNVTPSLKTTEILRILGMRVRPNLSPQDSRYSTYQVSFAMMQNRADELGWNQEKSNQITSDLHHQIMSHFEASNHAIATTYLGRDQLFTEPYREKPVSTFSLEQVPGVEIFDLIQPALDKSLLQLHKMEQSKLYMLNNQVKRMVRAAKRYPLAARMIKVAKQGLQ